MNFFSGYTNFFFVQGMMPRVMMFGLGPGRHSERVVGGLTLDTPSGGGRTTTSTTY